MIPNPLLVFEVLMQETPYSHFDSGSEGITPECRTCRFHRPHWKYQSCSFEECPPDIRNIRAYLLTTLYNAPATMYNFCLESLHVIVAKLMSLNVIFLLCLLYPPS